MSRIQVIAKNVNSPAPLHLPLRPPTTALCDKAVHRAHHFPVGAKNWLIGGGGDMVNGLDGKDRGVGWLQWGIKGTDIFRSDSEMLYMFLHHVIVPTIQ